MVVRELNNPFGATQNPHSLAVDGAVATTGLLTPAGVASQWQWQRLGLRGLPCGGSGIRGLGCAGCSGCSGKAPGGLGDLTTDDLSTIFGTSSIWLLLAGGGLLWYMFQGEPAKERRSAIKAENRRHSAAISGIKRTKKRFRRYGAGSKGSGGSKDTGDVDTENKKWISGAWRDASYEE